MKRVADYLEKASIDETLTAARSCGERDYLMIRVLWRSSIRINKLPNLRPQDIEYQNHVINVVKARRGKRGHCRDQLTALKIRSV